MPTANAVGGGGFCNELAIEPNCALRPVANTSALAVPLTTELPMNTRLGGMTVSDAGADDHRLLFRRIGLAGKQCLIDKKVTGFDQTSVRRDEIARAKQNDIAGNQFRCRDVNALSVPKCFDRQADPLAQTLGGILRLALLRHVQDDGHKNNSGDNDKARNVSG